MGHADCDMPGLNQKDERAPEKNLHLWGAAVQASPGRVGFTPLPCVVEVCVHLRTELEVLCRVPCTLEEAGWGLMGSSHLLSGKDSHCLKYKMPGMPGCFHQLGT